MCLGCYILPAFHIAHGSGNRTIVVGALNAAGTQKASYSNHAGVYKDYFITAPVDGGWCSSGTSCSAPVVSGAAALIMDRYNTNAADTRDILFETADDIGAPGVDSVFGHGRLNARRALSPLGALR